MSMQQSIPEAVGPFRLYPPIEGTSQTGWTLAWEGVWMPGSYADRDAVVLIAGLSLGAPYAEGIDLMNRLQERYNKAVPSQDITVQHILSVWDPYSR